MLSSERNISIFTELWDEVISWWWLRGIFFPVPGMSECVLSVEDTNLSRGDICVFTEVWHKVVFWWALWSFICWVSELVSKDTFCGGEGSISFSDFTGLSTEVWDGISLFESSLMCSWRPGEVKFPSFVQVDSEIEREPLLTWEAGAHKGFKKNYFVPNFGP